jgi:hypothetical protein
MQFTPAKSSAAFDQPRPVIISEFGPPALACIRSWGRCGFPVGMICVRSTAATLPNSRFLTSYCTLRPGDLFTEKGIHIIVDYLQGFGATAIIAINEKISCWLNDMRNKIPPAVQICAPSNDITLSLLSKTNQLNAAKKVGFDALPTYQIDKTPGSAERIHPAHFPVCLRPDRPNTVFPGFKVRIVESLEELRRFVNALQKVETPILAQPFADLPNLVVHGARTVCGKILGVHAFLVDRKFRGVTLTLRPYSIDTSLQDKCAAFADYFKITGSFHFEFLLDPKSGKALFLELNARLGGTTAKVFACGYDEPLLAISAYGIGQFHPVRLSDHVVAGKHALVKFALCAVKGRLSMLDYPNESMIKRLIRCIYGLVVFRDEVLSLSDIKGTIAFYRSLLCRS